MAVKKLGLKQRYAHMTRGLDWETTYQPMDKVFPYDTFEGIKIKDWSAWEDPFRLTMDAYWKFQAEKERKLYAVLDAFAQNNGQTNISDGRYVNVVKLFLTGISPLEYQAHRGFAFAGRHLRGVGPRVAAQMQSLDELRHIQTQIHTHQPLQQVLRRHRRIPAHARPRVVPLGAEVVLRRRPHRGPVRVHDRDRLRLRVRADQPAVRAVHVGRRLQRRHVDGDLRLLGPVRREPAHDARPRGHQVPARAAPGQPADRAEVGRQVVLARLPAARPRRDDDGLHAAEEGDVLEGSLGDLLHRGRRLAVPGPRPLRPASAEIRRRRRPRRPSTSRTRTGRSSTSTPTPPRSTPGCRIASTSTGCRRNIRTPSTSTIVRAGRCGRRWRRQGKRFYNMALPQLCQTCQIPMVFTEPGDPTTICFRTSKFKGDAYHFCSDGCKDIFDDEPEKYVQAWLPVHQIFQGNCGGATVPDVLDCYRHERRRRQHGLRRLAGREALEQLAGGSGQGRGIGPIQSNP